MDCNSGTEALSPRQTLHMDHFCDITVDLVEQVGWCSADPPQAFGWGFHHSQAHNYGKRRSLVQYHNMTQSHTNGRCVIFAWCTTSQPRSLRHEHIQACLMLSLMNSPPELLFLSASGSDQQADTGPVVTDIKLQIFLSKFGKKTMTTVTTFHHCW